MKKSSLVYNFILIIYTILLGVLIYSLVNIITSIAELQNVFLWKKVVVGLLFSFNSLIFAYFWLNAIKDLMYSVFYVFLKKRLYKKYGKYDRDCVDTSKKVLLLYCTCNDFNKEALFESSKQDYKNCKVVILDDSTKEEYLSQIDEYVKENNCELVRRKEHINFKAGNLNNYLSSLSEQDYDYFVVLDSDEIIPNNYVTKILSYFECDEKIGAVQATHIAKKGTNWFQSLLGMCVQSNGKICQIMKNFYGSSSLFGHGMMLSRQCYVSCGGFPNVVAEDIAISVQIKNAGYDIVFAPNVVCQEEFPNNYISLKKRQCKWTQGNLEYMKKYHKDINNSKMRWFEKLDLKLSHYSLPIIPIISLLLVLNTIAMGFLKCFPTGYGAWFIVLLVVFLLSPLIPDLFTYTGTKRTFLVIPYFICNMITYASMTPMMIKTVFLGLLGRKAKFIITPKDEHKISFAEMIKATYGSILFGIILGVLTYFSLKSITSTTILALSCILCPFVVMLANIKTKPKKEKIKKDKKRKNLELSNEIDDTEVVNTNL